VGVRAVRSDVAIVLDLDGGDLGLGIASLQRALQEDLVDAKKVVLSIGVILELGELLWQQWKQMSNEQFHACLFIAT
jgi:hypothetical protein